MTAFIAWIALSGVLLIVVYLNWDQRASWEKGEDTVRRLLRELRAQAKEEPNGEASAE